MNQQLLLDFPKYLSYRTHDFIVDACNEYAWKSIDQIPELFQKDRISYGLIVQGPAKAGKTHLSYIFQEKYQAYRIEAEYLSQLTEFSLEIDGNKAYVIDTIETYLPQFVDALFHLCNAIKEKKGFLMITSSLNPMIWPVPLPDLKSRLLHFPVVEIKTPSDQLLEKIILKTFSNLQIHLDSKVITFMLNHVERSLEHLYPFIMAFNNWSLSHKKPFTIPSLKEFMNHYNT